jgi:hypothetical protein
MMLHPASGDPARPVPLPAPRAMPAELHSTQPAIQPAQRKQRIASFKIVHIQIPVNVDYLII